MTVSPGGGLQTGTAALRAAHDTTLQSGNCAAGLERRSVAVKMQFGRKLNQRQLRRRLGAPVFRPARAAR